MALGREMTGVLTLRPELAQVRRFEAGIEPENTASRRCLEATGFRSRSEQPEVEGMLYRRTRRGGAAHHGTLLA
jgi:RimJ/RimL family protein N-acetyltransferase